jgi:hypothetical protein
MFASLDWSRGHFIIASANTKPLATVESIIDFLLTNHKNTYAFLSFRFSASNLIPLGYLWRWATMDKFTMRSSIPVDGRLIVGFIFFTEKVGQ